VFPCFWYVIISKEALNFGLKNLSGLVHRWHVPEPGQAVRPHQREGDDDRYRRQRQRRHLPQAGGFRDALLKDQD